MNKIFYDEITQVDYAIIAPNGLPYGNSFRLSASVSGDLNGEEQVVVDFSTFKKRAKSYIDGPDTGIDHKLWVNYEGNISEGISTVYSNILPPEKAIYKFTDQDIDFKSIDQYIGLVAEKVVKIKAQELSELLGQKVELFINPMNYQYFKAESFKCLRYVHGLPKSTSWGCQNNVHGHIGKICLSIDHEPTLEPIIINELMGELLGKEVKSKLPNLHLFGTDEFVGHGEYNLELRSETLSRGKSAYGLLSNCIELVKDYPEYSVYTVNSDSEYSMVRLKGVPYTTIENITYSFNSAVARLLKNYGHFTYEISVYEGLGKGATLGGLT